ncbi:MULTISPECIES: HDIG domain-containing metalloprotein [Prevotella]|uniref:Phosphohydrolase n=1 Tax=Prevotella lacticifex TaxID=2854755 RepID=A0A9R1CXX4_9BACT|nr:MULTISPECIES: HDIG domain-containing metalloprotein [Prevotella]MDD6854577.1 HDIG domain-containing protein [Prevotella sp.]MDY6266740.1 HDIG domain-containing protein [Prevotella sp.]GJG35186.1 phosphohydrolase [Prevotella lacticifex]GJG39763.1 phosphohydrolase [Prevotella lacticifex]GJG41555.1 phosphohydrolase [Prevotella lacticifex]
MDYKAIIDKYYPEDNKLRDILITHSTLVMKRAVSICDAHPELAMDRQFIIEAAMLHDIGICRCNAPGIECYGSEPYICHGRCGAEMLRAEGFPRHARVCERHTGAGLTKEEIVSQDLPLPHQDFLPETMEEKVICYADKFYSKTHPRREKTYEQAEHSLAKFGKEGLERFRQWHDMFENSETLKTKDNE